MYDFYGISLLFYYFLLFDAQVLVSTYLLTLIIGDVRQDFFAILSRGILRILQPNCALNGYRIS